ncbi:hypothetical protein QQG74_09805 [Micromonospora sp. FIMYZ51]|uniref:hypothetical protein n=1 Tax=Micromonospora sp. FIMYZ51 TaxID=3051832 RepID=UPI00311E3D4C
MTRYVCTAHRPAAVALVAMVGPVQVMETNTEYWRRQAQVVVLPPRIDPVGEAA